MARLLSRLFGRSANLRPAPAALAIQGPIEEQTVPRYCAQSFLSVAIGDVFDERYEIIAKLGFGSNSTVWLAKDIRW